MAGEWLVHDGFQSCPYLPGRVARLPLYRQGRRLDLDEADERFARGERRVGWSLYRIACPTCSACKPIRVLVDDFRPSRSQRRVLKRWPSDTHIEIGPPQWDEPRIDLFRRHKISRGLAEPDDGLMGVEGYVAWLASSCMHTVEMAYYWGDRLIGVGILDLGRTAASSVYFYFDPDHEVARLSPGVYSVLQELEFCRRTRRRHLYLGLYVEDCRQLVYKAQYRPHERLEDGDWRHFERKG